MWKCGHSWGRYLRRYGCSYESDRTFLTNREQNEPLTQTYQWKRGTRAKLVPTFIFPLCLLVLHSGSNFSESIEKLAFLYEQTRPSHPKSEPSWLIPIATKGVVVSVAGLPSAIMSLQGKVSRLLLQLKQPHMVWEVTWHLFTFQLRYPVRVCFMGDAV